ncbi:rho GTPase-activating protein 40-like isoform X6 [Heterodontus francisci]|uniref:rho GTPase-activating protein 40-like isoform X6 n=1 Tax=Heterodontus francisci TaxID=7792 RepID=UPI00355B7DB8
MENDKKTNVISKTYSSIPRPKLYANSLPWNFPQRRESSPSIMSHMQSQHFQELLTSDCSSSQDSLDNLSMDDFWTEVENIKESRGTEPDENMDVKIPDDGEVEADWLQDAGLSTLIKDGSRNDDDMVLLSTLTRTQSAAVQRRVDSYTLSMRIKSKQPVRDVRDIFAGPKFSSTQDTKSSVIDILQPEQHLEHLRPEEEKREDNKLFGVPLAHLIENDQKIDPNTKVPLFLKELLCCLEDNCLETEGILRISGSVARIKNLQQELDANFYPKRFDWKKVHHNDLAGLLKTFIRELPCPLLTAEYVTAFAAVKHISDQTQMIHALNLLVVILPEIYRATLKFLLEFLRKVIDKEKKNKMNLWNVSTIIAPNLFMHKGIPNKTDGNEKQQAEKAANVVRMLIHYQDLLWTIPYFLVAQVRKLNENSIKKYDKRLKNLLKKIHTDKHDKQHVEQQLNKAIKIQAPQLLKDTLEVQLNSKITVRDLVAQFQKQLSCSNLDATNADFTKRSNGSTDYPEFCLYEVGGNIGERCLDPGTCMLELYKINPQAEWVIRQHATSSKES